MINAIAEKRTEARQTSMEQTTMPRFRLEGPRPCTIFQFALILAKPTHVCQLDPQYGVNNSVVQGRGQKSKQKHTAKNFVVFHNHSPLLTMVQCRNLTITNRIHLLLIYLILKTRQALNSVCCNKEGQLKDSSSYS